MDDDEYRLLSKCCLLIPVCALFAGATYTLHKGADVFSRAFLFAAFGFVLVVYVFVPVALVTAVLSFVGSRRKQARYHFLAASTVSTYWLWLVYQCNQIDHVGISPFM